jgi:hypothetical protein
MNNYIKEQFYATTTISNPNEYKWSVNSDNTVTITKYTPNGNKAGLLKEHLTIPDKLDEKKVSAIGNNSFASNTNFTLVTIPSAVTTIGAGAFMNCSNLKLVSFYRTGSLTNIEADAFKNTKISDPIIPPSVKLIGDGAFNTIKLVSVNFLGNSPTFTRNAFNSQNNNGNNMENRIYIYYYKNKSKFNKTDEDKFFYVELREMKLPEEKKPVGPLYAIIITTIVMILISLILYKLLK